MPNMKLPRPPRTATNDRSARGKAIPKSARQVKHDLERKAMLAKAKANRMAHGAKR